MVTILDRVDLEHFHHPESSVGCYILQPIDMGHNLREKLIYAYKLDKVAPISLFHSNVGRGLPLYSELFIYLTFFIQSSHLHNHITSAMWVFLVPKT